MDNGASSYRRFLDGDDKGLAEIVRDYKDGLILYLNGFVSNISIAEELMEETFFKIITKKPRFNPKHSFKTWLYTIGRNVVIDYLRHNSKLSVRTDKLAASYGELFAIKNNYSMLSLKAIMVSIYESKYFYEIFKFFTKNT